MQRWLDDLYHQRLNPWWPAERAHVDRRYQDLPFPTRSQTIPAGMQIELHWTCDQLLGFISTWSALRRAGEQAPALLHDFHTELLELWPADQPQLQLHLPLMGRWGRLP